MTATFSRRRPHAMPCRRAIATTYRRFSSYHSRSPMSRFSPSASTVSPIPPRRRPDFGHHCCRAFLFDEIMRRWRQHGTIVSFSSSHSFSRRRHQCFMPRLLAFVSRARTAFFTILLRTHDTPFSRMMTASSPTTARQPPRLILRHFGQRCELLKQSLDFVSLPPRVIAYIAAFHLPAHDILPVAGAALGRVVQMRVRHASFLGHFLTILPFRRAQYAHFAQRLSGRSTSAPAARCASSDGLSARQYSPAFHVSAGGLFHYTTMAIPASARWPARAARIEYW